MNDHDQDPTPTPRTSPRASPAARPRRRRVLFGLNTILAVAVAIVVVLLVNWLAYRQFFRFDFTAMGVYSLSPQTQRVLDGLDADHELVTLFSTQTQPLSRRRVRDLLDEYARSSRRIETTHLNPNLDLARYDAFAARLRERYADEIEGQRRALETARDAIARIVKEVDPVLARLRLTLGDEAFAEGQHRQRVQQVFSVLSNLADGERTVREEIERGLSSPLPNYAELLRLLESELSNVSRRVLPTAVQWFEQAADSGDVPAASQENLLRAVETLESLREPVRRAVAAIGDAEPADDYQRVRSSLVGGGGAVVVLGPERARVISEQEMFIEMDPRVAQAAEGAPGEVETRFLGEERVTGALVSLQLDQPPMVVFVNGGGMQALGPRGQYGHVADRLRSLNAEVTQWSPSGASTPWGGMRQPQPAPQPAAGQKAVWVVLPQAPDNPANPMEPSGGGGARIVEVLKERLAAGDSAMLMLGVRAGTAAAAPDPLAALAGEWGLHASLDRLVVREVAVGETRTATLPTFDVSSWPGQGAITRSLSGMTGRFVAPAPLSVEDAEGVKGTPLVRLEGKRMWTLDAMDVASQEDLLRAEYEGDRASEAFVIAGAAEAVEAPARLAVFTEATWASDQLTTLGYLPGFGLRGPGVVEQGGIAEYPANAELFVNTALWLAGLDELIATSPRVQKARRIDDMPERVRATTVAVLMGGVPVVALVLGVAVYLVRRRG